MINNFEIGSNFGRESRLQPTPEAINMILAEMGEPGVFGQAHTPTWIKAVARATEGASLIEIGLSNRH